jgi:hypothetical protein
MRDYKQIVGVIAGLEQGFPVASLMYADIPLWPVLRQQIANSLFWETVPDTAPLKAKVYRAVPPIVARLILGAAQRTASSILRGKIAGPSEVMFATAGFEYVPFDGKLYNKFLDPVKERLDARGVSHADIELGFGGKDYSPKHSPTIDLRKEAALVSRAALFGTPGFSRSQSAVLNEFARYSVERQGIRIDLPSVINRASRISALADLFSAVLSAVQPKACMFVCHYQDTTMALAHASRKKGVTTVELQHSVVAEYDWNWCQWTAVADGGYSTMPDIFWAWGEKYVGMLGCWQQRPNTNLSPRVGGNLWIWKWQQAGETIPQRTADLAGSGKTVIYTVPFGDASLMAEWFPPELEDAMRRSPPDWKWHVRLHYKSGDALVQSVRLHARRLGPSVEVHHADEHHLFHLFSIANAHISQTSTTALEAEAFGVPNLIIGAVGKDWFAEEIRSGSYAFAATAEEILDFINAPPDPGHHPEAMVTDPGAADALLTDLHLGQAANA